MRNIYLKQFLILFLANFILALVYLLLVYLSYDFFYSIVQIFIFFFLSTYAVVSLLVLVNQFFKDYVGYAFMGLLLLKGLASILFLVPSFIDDPKPLFSDLMSFFVPYFLFLIYEAYFSIRLLNTSNNH